MKEYKTDRFTVKVHGQPDTEKLKKAITRFAKRAEMMGKVDTK